MFNKHQGGKGDRPILPKDQKTYDDNWNQIFKKKKDEDCVGEQPKQYPSEVIR